MSAVEALRRALRGMPQPLGAMLSLVPYSWRPGMGGGYRRRRRLIVEFRRWPAERRRQYVLDRIRRIVAHAQANVPFYRRLYERAKLSADSLKTFDDIRRLPIVNKQMMREVDLPERSWRQPGRLSFNTGGSSGSPLALYASRACMQNEWAHMHEAWSQVGYRPGALKLQFAGRPNPGGEALAYDALSNHYTVNIYSPREEILDALRRRMDRYPIRYLHGYPSAVFDFACCCQQQAGDVVERLSQTLRGVLLGSEYPAPVFRRRIEEVFGAPTLSWYGHTEMAVLATERGQEGLYEPFPTHGHAEAVEMADGTTRLIGTSYENLACPFIRYDTGDEIQPAEVQGGLLASFRIAGGREGDFILDRRGQRISLTGLIFGRHHAVFDRARHVQVCQDRPGRARLIVTSRSGELSLGELPGLFDLWGTDIEFEFALTAEPLLSPMGKLVLKVDPPTPSAQ